MLKLEEGRYYYSIGRVSHLIGISSYLIRRLSDRHLSNVYRSKGRRIFTPTQVAILYKLYTLSKHMHHKSIDIVVKIGRLDKFYNLFYTI